MKEGGGGAGAQDRWLARNLAVKVLPNLEEAYIKLREQCLRTRRAEEQDAAEGTHRRCVPGRRARARASGIVESTGPNLRVPCFIHSLGTSAAPPKWTRARMGSEAASLKPIKMIITWKKTIRW
eukprot:3598996-Pleurochrysis_carterae.AAC.4